MAICFVSGKIQTAYVCVIHCAPWVFPLPRISPFLNSLRIFNFSTACYAPATKKCRVGGPSGFAVGTVKSRVPDGGPCQRRHRYAS